MDSQQKSTSEAPRSRRFVDLVLDPIDMIRCLRRDADQGLNIWGPALLAPQLIGGLYFIGRPEGMVVLAGLFVMLVTAGYIHRHQPLSRLIGICQAWWLLTLPWLAKRAFEQDVVSVFSVWLWYVVLTMTASIVMDVWGLHLYLASDNKTYHRKKRLAETGG